MNSLLWIIAIVIFQAIVRALAKRAQQNAAGQAGAAVPGVSDPLSATPRTAQPKTRVAGNVQGSTQSAQSAQSARFQADARFPKAVPIARSPIGPSAGKPVKAVKTAKPAGTVRLPATAPGSAPPGSAPRGSAARGSAARGSTARGSTARGSTAGGSSARGSTAGGSTAGGTLDRGPNDFEESDAMQSRARLAQSVDRVRAAEAKISKSLIVGLEGIEIARSERLKVGKDLRVPALGIREALRSPARVREACLIAEILGAPRAARPF